MPDQPALDENTVLRRDDGWFGVNTDSPGFLEPLVTRLTAADKRQAVVIGAGGVERVVELELTDSEKDGLAKSADAVKGLIDACRKLEPKLG